MVIPTARPMSWRMERGNRMAISRRWVRHWEILMVKNLHWEIRTG
jgi:hypothetical protein